MTTTRAIVAQHGPMSLRFEVGEAKETDAGEIKLSLNATAIEKDHELVIEKPEPQMARGCVPGWHIFRGVLDGISLVGEYCMCGEFVRNASERGMVAARVGTTKTVPL